MATTVFEVYLASDLNFSDANPSVGDTVTLVSGYDGSNDTILTIEDDDTTLDGDNARNEDGNDLNQFGTAVFADGTVIGGSNYNVYSEEQFELTGDDGSTITMYVIEIDSDPDSRLGDGDFIGYLPSSPLQPGVTYTVSSTSNTTQTTAPEFNEVEGAICFSADCLIETKDGPRPAGDLETGTLVRTLDNGFQPLRWIFRRKISLTELSRSPQLRPILFRAGSLAAGKPEVDMRLSPQHRIVTRSPQNELFFGENTLLVPAKAMVNGETILVDDNARSVEYVHLLFDQHEIVFSNGVETESLNPGVQVLRSLSDDAQNELKQIFPDLFLSPDSCYPDRYASVTTTEAHVLA